MTTPMASILQAAGRRPTDRLNILCAPTHEAFETQLAKTGHNFFAFRAEGIKDWNRAFRPLPENYTLIQKIKAGESFGFPADLDFDIVLSQNKFGQFGYCKQFAQMLHLPLISLEHTLPVPSWSADQRLGFKNMRGHVNIFISEFSRDAWGFNDTDSNVIHHGIDTQTFSTDKLVAQNNSILSVVNDWRNRDWCCGFNLWEQATRGLQVKVVGDNPGMSRPAASVKELVHRYREARIFLNTSLISPVPTALLEAMSCGCAVVSTATCMIPSVVHHGENGLLGTTPQELRANLELLLNDRGLCSRLGAAARKTVEEHFNETRFVREWDETFRAAANIPYLGV